MCYNMNMKKNHKILTIFLCLVMFFMAGCGDGGFGAGSEGSPINLEGVKVMRKPAEYSIGELVGEENSEYFYNLLSRSIMRFLYLTYTNGIESADLKYRESILNGTTLENILNNTNPDRYFYYDSIRYSIESIAVNNVESVLEIVLDTESAWNFGFDNYYTLDEAVTSFPILALVSNHDEIISTTYTENGNLLNINANYLTYTDSIYGTPGDYSTIYYGADRYENDILMYGESPYYQEFVAGETVTALNTYQDALEYITYLFVLGYDYETEDGAVNSEDAPYFNLQISQNMQSVDFNGNTLRLNIPSITVERTPNGRTNVSINEALSEIKERYNVLGTYIGVTDENKEQLVRYILDYVIGLDNGENGDYSFEIITEEDGGGGTPIITSRRQVDVNRDYENVVRNIVDVACSEVRIGGVEGDDEVFIDTAYPISEIVDYKNDYFYTQWYDENGNTSDKNILGHVNAAEYQAMSISLPAEEIGYFLTDIQLCFEYYDDNPNDESELVYDELNGLTLNLGINYFDNQGNILYSSEPVQKNIKYGRLLSDADYHTGVDPDYRNVYFTTSDDVVSDNIYGAVFSQIEKIPLKMQFDNNIDDGVLNAELNGEEVNEYEHVIKITGSSPAREYYKMNPSSSYGQYATFNPDMFAGKTDYIEIYFDVLKDKNNLNKNYNFKVGLVWVLTDSYKKDDPDYVGALSMSFLDDIDLIRKKF